jgi:hypothetical protein
MRGAGQPVESHAAIRDRANHAKRRQRARRRTQTGLTNSCDVLRAMEPEIQWVYSYVTNDKIYCLYRAPDEAMLKEHPRQAGLPAGSVSRVHTVIDPTTAE